MSPKPLRKRHRRHGKIISYLSRLFRKFRQPQAQERGTTRDIDPESRLHAKAASLVYDTEGKPIPEGYDFDRVSAETGILRDSKNKRAIVGVRGTDNFDDALTDMDVMIGNIRNTDRYKRSKQEVSETVQRLRDDGYDVSLSGHSLGGALAHHLSDELGLQAHIFNPLFQSENTPMNSNVVAHMTVDDPASLLYQTQGQVNLYQNPEPGVLNTHTINAFYGKRNRRHGLSIRFIR